MLPCAALRRFSAAPAVSTLHPCCTPRRRGNYSRSSALSHFFTLPKRDAHSVYKQRCNPAAMLINSLQIKPNRQAWQPNDSQTGSLRCFWAHPINLNSSYEWGKKTVTKVNTKQWRVLICFQKTKTYVQIKMSTQPQTLQRWLKKVWSMSQGNIQIQQYKNKNVLYR